MASFSRTIAKKLALAIPLVGPHLREYLRLRSYPFPPGHYYSPIPDIEEIRTGERKTWRRENIKGIPGIDLNEQAQLGLLDQLAQYYDQQPFAEHKTVGRRYYFANDFFSFSDGIFYYSMLRHLKPKRACASFGYTWIALFYVSLLLLAVTQQGLVSFLFRLRPLTFLGTLAYGLYLLHQPILGIVYGLVGKASPSLAGFTAVGLTSLSGLLLLALARASWLYFEKPLIKRGALYHQYYCGSPRVPDLFDQTPSESRMLSVSVGASFTGDERIGVPIVIKETSL